MVVMVAVLLHEGLGYVMRGRGVGEQSADVRGRAWMCCHPLAGFDCCVVALS